MLAIPVTFWAHCLGIGAAWACGALVAWWQNRAILAQSRWLAPITGSNYYQVLAVSALAGAWLLGWLNTIRIGLAPSHSIAGALAGGIMGVELWTADRAVGARPGAR